jgi:hypothetical protein
MPGPLAIWAYQTPDLCYRALRLSWISPVIRKLEVANKDRLPRMARHSTFNGDIFREYFFALCNSVRLPDGARPVALNALGYRLPGEPARR